MTYTILTLKVANLLHTRCMALPPSSPKEDDCLRTSHLPTPHDPALISVLGAIVDATEWQLLMSCCRHRRMP